MRVDDVVELVTHAKQRGQGLWLGNLNLHGAYLYLKDETFADFCDRADVLLIDGWPILAAASTRRRPLTSDYRVGSTDWVDALLRGPHRLRIVAVGSDPATARRAAEHAASVSRCSWDAVDGYDFRHRPVGTESERPLGELLREADLVLVGLGMPKQEQWILENADDLRGKVVANVGGCFDYFGGKQSLAPRWLGPLRLEWAYRLLRDPRRLSHRYLVEPLLLTAALWRRNRQRRKES
jgi:N-acetylglucosaminyldiphosphoundecaprenol N-acetyl-beta-D-mannosaminyltransferase